MVNVKSSPTDSPVNVPRVDLDQTNQCDHGHATTAEIRRLDTGGGGGVLICRDHYDVEMRFRRERIAAGVPFDLPAWINLAVYADEVRS